jgi:hypothetical protein
MKKNVSLLCKALLLFGVLGATLALRPAVVADPASGVEVSDEIAVKAADLPVSPAQAAEVADGFVAAIRCSVGTGHWRVLQLNQPWWGGNLEYDVHWHIDSGASVEKHSPSLWVDAVTGGITGVFDWSASRDRLVSAGPPGLTEEKAIEAARKHASLMGLPEDAVVASVKLLQDDEWGKSTYQWFVCFHHYFGQAEYKDDQIQVSLHPDTGELYSMRKAWAMQPPPAVEAKISQSDALTLGKGYLLKMGKKTSGLNEMKLMVVRPLKEPTEGYSHCGEPSRVAWVVTYSREPGSGDIEQVWIDVEDGTLLNYIGCY